MMNKEMNNTGNEQPGVAGMAHIEQFETTLHRLLGSYLVQKGGIDERLPEMPDIEERWEGICEAYLADGVKEFVNYPTASLGWMMFIGMAVAKMWDDDWEMYSQFKDLYKILRDGRGYDNLDDYVCYDILGLDERQAGIVSASVADTASMVYNLLMRGGFEPSTPEAFGAYVRCLHLLYYFGAAVQLHGMGYRMVRM